ncbi:hypothetical protein HanPSC8_Chr17g0794871 [Helianthus annuus]|nr:hypothetical protein HanIR_Chr17g0899261 [Helianthus annuus]KAJ0815206.1 hypothetical protein HanPSC8_Chr17g0794871 [Helianthus annuus]
MSDRARSFGRRADNNEKTTKATGNNTAAPIPRRSFNPSSSRFSEAEFGIDEFEDFTWEEEHEGRRVNSMSISEMVQKGMIIGGQYGRPPPPGWDKLSLSQQSEIHRLTLLQGLKVLQEASGINNKMKKSKE